LFYKKLNLNWSEGKQFDLLGWVKLLDVPDVVSLIDIFFLIFLFLDDSLSEGLNIKFAIKLIQILMHI
jgi:hypothetical protein